MDFEWDENKNVTNNDKHGVSFPEAARMLMLGRVHKVSSTYEDEKRIVATGLIGTRYVTVIYTMRGSVYRIISARSARQNERQNYEEQGENSPLHE